MGAIIQQALVVENNGHSAILNAAEAGTRCLSAAGVSVQEVGLLINVGIFRDKNIMEPSIASLIQKEMGLGLDVREDNPGHYCFSFDVVNGAGGFLNAVQVAEAYLKNGTVRYAIIVGGDVHPSMTDHEDFPYVAVGAAVLLCWSDEADRGFQGVSYHSEFDGESRVAAYGDFETMGADGRNSGSFSRAEGFEHHLLDIAATHTLAFLKGVNSTSIQYLISSEPTPDFAGRLCDASGLAATGVKTAESYEMLGGDAHTAAPMAAFALLAPSLSPGNTVLFSLVGSGDACASVLYNV